MQLAKQTTGPLAGFPLLEIDWPKFIAYKQAAYDQHVGYGFGDKDPDLGTFPPDYTEIDCSGFVRTLLDYATNGETQQYALPDGSYLEADWFAAQGFKSIAPEDYDMVPDWRSYLLVATHAPGGHGGDSTGHIWLLIHEHSVESYGGHGPGERPWNWSWFPEHVDTIHVIAHMPD